MKFKDIKLKNLGEFYIFTYKTEKIICKEDDNCLIINISNILEEKKFFKNLLLQNIKIDFIKSDEHFTENKFLNGYYTNKKDFFKIISWVLPERYEMYKKMFSLIQIHLFIYKIKESNNKLNSFIKSKKYTYNN